MTSAVSYKANVVFNSVQVFIYRLSVYAHTTQIIVIVRTFLVVIRF